MVSQPAPSPSFWRAVGITLETCVRNWRTCLLLASLYSVFIGVANGVARSFSFGLEPSSISSSELVAVGAAVIGAVGTLALIGIFVYPPTIGALAIVGSASVYGDEIDPQGVLRQALDKALDAIGAFVLTLLIVLAPWIAAALLALVIGAAFGASVVFAALAVVTVLLVVPAVYVVVRLSLAVPVVMREGLGSMDALRRSWQLVHGAWWWVFGVGLVVGIVGATLSGALSSIGGRTSGAVGFVVVSITTALGAAVSISLIGVAMGVVYSSRTPESSEPPEPVAAPPADKPAPPLDKPVPPPGEATPPAE